MNEPPDPFNLQRFVEAQDAAYDRVLDELRGGRKLSHWMWFIFPQIQGLGSSEISHRFAILCLEEACAYLEHPVLGPRLIGCTQLVLAAKANSIVDIFDSPDDLKFHSCMTLFAYATKKNEVFLRAIEQYFSGEEDRQTVARLFPNAT